MVTVDAMIKACENEIGYTESPPNSNRTKYAKMAGHIDGYPWCATFLVAMAESVGLRLPSTSAYTPRMAEAFIKAVQWGMMPKIGAFAFFDFPNDPITRIQHVGIVFAYDRYRILTIEGNTSPDDHGSQTNGGGVYARTRDPALVVGYGYPHYTVEDIDVLTQDQSDDLKACKNYSAAMADTILPGMANDLRRIADAIEAMNRQA